MFQNKTQREANILKEETEAEEHINEPQDNFKWPSMRVTGVPEGEEKEDRKKYLNKVRA